MNYKGAEYRDIPGFDGEYKVSEYGDVIHLVNVKHQEKHGLTFVVLKRNGKSFCRSVNKLVDVLFNGGSESSKMVSDEQIIAMAEDGMTCADIARELGYRKTSTVSRRLRKLGLSIKDFSDEKACVVCGRTFKSDKKYALCCSSECSKKRKNSSRASRAREKTKASGSDFDSSVNLAGLINRDNNTCYICGGKCNQEDKSWGTFGPEYPTIDHVVPLSKGGSHTWDNVRLAHARCNIDKGAS